MAQRDPQLKSSELSSELSDLVVGWQGGQAVVRELSPRNLRWVLTSGSLGLLKSGTHLLQSRVLSPNEHALDHRCRFESLALSSRQWAVLTSLAKVARTGRGCPASPRSARYHTRLRPTARSCFRFLRSRDGQVTRPLPLVGLVELPCRPTAAGARLFRLSSWLGQLQRRAPGGAGLMMEVWSGRPRGGV